MTYRLFAITMCLLLLPSSLVCAAWHEANNHRDTGRQGRQPITAAAVCKIPLPLVANHIVKKFTVFEIGSTETQRIDKAGNRSIGVSRHNAHPENVFMIPCLRDKQNTLSFSFLQAEGGQTPPEESVERGHDALDRRWSKYPWYDAENDEVKPIRFGKPDVRHSSSWDPKLPAALATLLQGLMWTALIVVLIIVVYFLVSAFWKNRHLKMTQRVKRSTDDDDHRRRIEALPFPVQAANRDFLAEARRFYQQGQYGEAVKYLFSYQLVQLDKHRLVRLTRGKTNRQYLRELARRRTGSITGLLEQTMLAFEDFFFGNHPIDRMRFESVWSRLDEFQAQLAGRKSA